MTEEAPPYVAPEAGQPGALLNSPNDIAVHSDGTVYFTDPTFGMSEDPELDFAGVFRIAPDGNLTAERRGDMSEKPNGVVLSPDESRLSVSDTDARLVRVFDVAADGSLSEAEEFVTTDGNPDGMAVDTACNLIVTSQHETDDGDVVEVFAPDGTPWGVILVPDRPTNAAFGDADGRTLYITGQGVVYRVRLASPGIY